MLRNPGIIVAAVHHDGRRAQIAGAALRDRNRIAVATSNFDIGIALLVELLVLGDLDGVGVAFEVDARFVVIAPAALRDCHLVTIADLLDEGGCSRR